MPVQMNSYLLPVSANLPYLLEDVYLRGGMRVVADVAARDKIAALARKPGMLVWCTAEQKMFQLGSDKKWEEANLGGGGSDDLRFVAPFTEAIDAEGKRVIGLNAGNRIPQSPGAGYVLQSGPNQTLAWVDGKGNADRGTRQLATFEPEEFLAPGQTVTFELEMSRTSMMISVELNAVDIEIQCHARKERTDANPYIFRSAANLLSDDGTRIEDGKLIKQRRYAFVANMDNTPNQYWTMKNLSSLPAKPKLSIVYLVLQ